MWENSLAFHFVPFLLSSDVCMLVINLELVIKENFNRIQRKKIKSLNSRFHFSWNVSFVRDWCIKYIFRPFFSDSVPSIWCAFNAVYDLKVFRFAIWRYTTRREVEGSLTETQTEFLLDFLKMISLFSLSNSVI